MEEIDRLRAQLATIEEYGTEEINAAIELRQALAQARTERDALAAEVEALKEEGQGEAG